MDGAIGDPEVESDNIAEEINSAADTNAEDCDGEILLNQPKETPEEFESSKQNSSENIEGHTTTNMSEKPSAAPTGGGLTMYERSVLQKEERERKLKALQETLEADFTFAPQRAAGNRSKRPGSGESVVSSLGDSPSTAGVISTGGVSVFSRLYNAETAASRAWQYIGRTFSGSDRSAIASKAPISTTASMAGNSTSGNRSTTKSKTASPRLEYLFKAGEEKLRARHLSDKEETEQIQRRIENEALKLPGVYTFRPQTKWDLVAQRREMAREAKEKEEDEAHRTIPKTIKAVSFFFFNFAL